MTILNLLSKMKNVGSSLWPFICLGLIAVLMYQNFSTNKLIVHTIRLQDSLDIIQKQLDITHAELKLRDSVIQKSLDSLKKQNSVIISKSKDIDRLKEEVLSKPHDPKIDTLIAAYDTVVNVYQEALLATARLANAAIQNSQAKDSIIDDYKRINESINKELDKWVKKNTQRRFDFGSAVIGAAATLLLTTVITVSVSQ